MRQTETGKNRRRPSATTAERRERRAAVEDPQIVMEAAAAFLAVRSRSVEETRQRLGHLGYRHALVDTVIERLLALRYLDDESFARAWVESRDRARPRGEQALRRELTLKGIRRDTVAVVLGERAAGLSADAGDQAPSGDLQARLGDLQAPSPDRVAAERLLERRRAALLREPDPRKRRQKAYALLARYGFDPDICRDVLANWLADPALAHSKTARGDPPDATAELGPEEQAEGSQDHEQQRGV